MDDQDCDGIWMELSHHEQDGRRLVVTVYVPKSLQREEPQVIQRRAPRVIQRVERAFALLEACFPRRICNEEIGDAMEVIHKMVAAKRPKWMISMKIVSTCFWVSTHAVLDYVIKVASAVKAVAGKGDGKDEK